MGRQVKQGLDFFTLDVDFFESIKIRKIRKDCGNQSIPILIALLCNIYREEGYYVGYDSDLTFLIAEQFGVSEDAVTETVRKAVAVEFFDSRMFNEYKILTSHAIQERYFLAVTKLRRKGVTVTGDFVLKSIFDMGYIDKLRGNVDFHVHKSNKCSDKSDKVEVEVEVDVEVDGKEDGKHPPSSTDEGLNAFHHFQRLCPQATPNQLTMITNLVNIYGLKDVVDAIDRTFERGKKDLMYTAGILRKWREADEQGVPRDRRRRNGQNRTGGDGGGDESEPSSIAHRWRIAK